MIKPEQNLPTKKALLSGAAVFVSTVLNLSTAMAQTPRNLKPLTASSNEIIYSGFDA